MSEKTEIETPKKKRVPKPKEIATIVEQPKPKKLSQSEALDIILEKFQTNSFLDIVLDKFRTTSFNDQEVIKIKEFLSEIVKATKKPFKLSEILKPRFVKIYNRFVPALEFLSQKQCELKNKMREANLKRLEQKNLKLKKKIETMKERCNL